MKRSLLILPIAMVAIMLSGCTAMMNSAYYGSDLYRTNNRAEVAAQLRAEAEAERLEAEARQAQWEARLAEANAQAAEAEYYASLSENPNYVNIVADDYESAYARRLYGFQSPNYKMPSSYYDMYTSGAAYYASAYDPAYYNVMVSGNQVWVEPKYITSMFGSWGATNVTFGLYSSPWNYGWSFHVDPFYYSWWGYPRYSWYDWNWNICYNPHYYDWYWYGCYYPYYYGHHHHHHHYPGYRPVPPPPSYRPNHGHGPDYRPGHGHTTGSGASYGPGNMNGRREYTSTRYTSPTTNRNYGGSGSRSEGRNDRGGSTSQGYNGNSVRPGGGKGTTITTGGNSRNDLKDSGTRVNTSLSNVGGNSSSGNNQNSNFRQGNSTTSTRTNTITVNNGVGSAVNNRGNVGTGGSTTNKNSNFRQGSSSSSTRSNTTVNSSSSSSSSNRSGNYRSSSSSSSNRSGNYRSSSSSSANKSSNYRSSSSSSTSRSSGSTVSSSRSNSSGSGSFRSGSSSSSSSGGSSRGRR